MKIAYFYYFTVLCLFWSCDQEDKGSHKIIDNDTVVSDIDLSKFMANQIYNQHIIFNVPKECQYQLDSLVNWIELAQPGGLNLKAWDLSSIQKLSQAIDTLGIIKPFIMDDYWQRINSKAYAYEMSNGELKKESFYHWAFQAGTF